MSVNIIRWESGADGIVVLTMDDPNQSANTLNADYVQWPRRSTDSNWSETGSRAILTSAKTSSPAPTSTKCRPDRTAAEFREGAEDQGGPAQVGEAGQPVVAAINGAALGGGWRLPWPATTG
jgi:3-hydroxyacyl-CoA dehydrogenase/enoyl-CoA hydratase/3-hydroxybutyryl-CoA epimerase